MESYNFARPFFLYLFCPFLMRWRNTLPPFHWTLAVPCLANDCRGPHNCLFAQMVPWVGVFTPPLLSTYLSSRAYVCLDYTVDCVYIWNHGPLCNPHRSEPPNSSLCLLATTPMVCFYYLSCVNFLFFVPLNTTLLMAYSLTIFPVHIWFFPPCTPNYSPPDLDPTHRFFSLFV